MPYYVIPHGVRITDCGDGTPHAEPMLFHTLPGAKGRANMLNETYGNHWHVVEVTTVWTTKTLYEAMKEDAQ